MDPYTYVRNLNLEHRQEQASSLPPVEPANPFNLHPDLNLAVVGGYLSRRIERATGIRTEAHNGWFCRSCPDCDAERP